MKEKIKDWFYIKENGKVREKVLFARIAVAVAVIVASLAAMSITAYAYFSCNVTSGANVIASAHYYLNTEHEYDLTPDGNGYFILDGTDTVTYEFNLVKPDEEGIAKVGYCKIEVKPDDQTAPEVFYTLPIGEYKVGEETKTVNDRTVKITVPKGKTAKIKFTAQWGSCASQENIIDETGVIVPEFLAVNSTVVFAQSAVSTNTLQQAPQTESSEEAAASSEKAESTVSSETEITASSKTDTAVPPQTDTTASESEAVSSDVSVEPEDTANSQNENSSEQQNSEESGNSSDEQASQEAAVGSEALGSTAEPTNQ